MQLCVSRGKLTCGVICKVHRLRVCNIRPASHLYVHLHQYIRTNVHLRTYFKKDMTNVFCELLSIKEPQAALQNKEATAQSYHKMLNNNTKQSPRIKVTFFECMGEMGMNICGCVNNSLSLFYFCLQQIFKEKNLWPTYASTLYSQMDHPSPPSSVRTVWVTPVSLLPENSDKMTL